MQFLNKKILVVVFFSLSVFLYINTLNHDFVLDDTIVITSNKYTQKGLSGIKEIFTHDSFEGAYGKQLNLTGGRYRPLSIAVFAVIYDYFALNPLPYHFFNIFLFALSIVILFLFLCKLFPDKNFIIPIITSLFFVTHPIHTEVVANIKSADEILVFLFSLLTLKLVYINKYKLIAWLLFCLALLSKENAITLIAIIPLLLLIKKVSLKSIILKTIPFLIISIIYIVVRTQIVGFFGKNTATTIVDNTYINTSYIDKLASISWVTLKYLGLLFFPNELSYDYSFNAVPVTNIGSFVGIISIIILIGLIGYSIYIYKKNPYLSFSIGFFFITYSIVSNFVFNIGTTMGERFIFISSFGFCLFWGVIFYALIQKKKIKNNLTAKYAISIALIIILFGFGYKTVKRNKDWKNNYTLYTTDVKKVPNSARAQLYCGIVKTNKSTGKNSVLLKQAIVHMEKAKSIAPDFLHVYKNLAIAYQKAKDPIKVIKTCEEFLALYPVQKTEKQILITDIQIECIALLGTAYGNLNKFDEAIKCYYDLVYVYKRYETSYIEKLGIAYAITQQYNKAIDVFKLGLKYYPNSKILLENLGKTYFNLGDVALGKKYIARSKKVQ